MKLPVGGLLYSLVHLGGFAGDLAFYCSRQGGRVLEMGCGDGRLAVSICLGGSPLSVLQQIQADGAAAAMAQQAAGEKHRPPDSYLGIDICEPLVATARERLAGFELAEVIQGDFLRPLPAG